MALSRTSFATASGLVFAGDLRGDLYAINSGDGTVLLRHSLGASAWGGLFTYALNCRTIRGDVVQVFFGGGQGKAKLTVLALPLPWLVLVSNRHLGSTGKT